MTRVLIANRGEIAVRIIRACRERGLATVAVYSDADARARHVGLADQAVRIGGPSPAESYLSVDAIMSAVSASGADAVHPGYGFLSEHPALPVACAAAGVTFIGPPANVIERMGSKIAARDLATQAGVPVVPGVTPRDQSDDGLIEAVATLGLPCLIKPSEGGGGIGMKAVHDLADVRESASAARREAVAAFGDGTLYVERLLLTPRHVEVQILADHHGHVVHLFERECSIQRRHQKVIEESPSPALTPALRDRMGRAAVSLATHAGYRNAGTVEFLVDGQGDSASFYFLEMNTRLQVEHPVTEQVTGLDLVHLQLAIAGDDPLPFTQQDITQRGHAMEARVYAEDPARGDLPQAGLLRLYREPALPGVRVDSGVGEGDEVSVHYDPMLAKVIATAPTREMARVRLIEALRQFPILGIQTNTGLLLRILEHPAVKAGDLDTHLLDRDGDALRAGLRAPVTADAQQLAEHVRRTGPVSGAVAAQDRAVTDAAWDPWVSLRGFRV